MLCLFAFSIILGCVAGQGSDCEIESSDQVIFGGARDVIDDIDLEACRMRCLEHDEDDYVCKAAVHYSANDQCLLYDVNGMEDPDRVIDSPDEDATSLLQFKRTKECDLPPQAFVCRSGKCEQCFFQNPLDSVGGGCPRNGQIFTSFEECNCKAQNTTALLVGKFYCDPASTTPYQCQTCGDKKGAKCPTDVKIHTFLPDCANSCTPSKFANVAPFYRPRKFGKAHKHIVFGEIAHRHTD